MDLITCTCCNPTQTLFVKGSLLTLFMFFRNTSLALGQSCHFYKCNFQRQFTEWQFGRSPRICSEVNAKKTSHSFSFEIIIVLCVYIYIYSNIVADTPPSNSMLPFENWLFLFMFGKLFTFFCCRKCSRTHWISPPRDHVINLHGKGWCVYYYQILTIVSRRPRDKKPGVNS